MGVIGAGQMGTGIAQVCALAVRLGLFPCPFGRPRSRPFYLCPFHSSTMEVKQEESGRIDITRVQAFVRPARLLDHRHKHIY